LGREGILATSGTIELSPNANGNGGDESSMQASMQEAFAALDANDDAEQRRSAIDKVFGSEGASNPLAALDRVLGGGVAEAPAAAPSDLDRELLDILRKGKKS
jgi:hypothetical protein